MANPDEDYTYVYLDFSEKLTPGIFSNKVFLRVSNLNKPNPLVQINDLLFKGTYDECVGTNIFFEEIEDPAPKTNIFEKETPIRLRPLITQTKLIKLKPVKLPRKDSQPNQHSESIALNLNQEYNTVLEKLEQGILNLDDLMHKEPEPQTNDHFEDVAYEPRVELSTEPEREIATLLETAKDKSAPSPLEVKYEKLKRLIRRPVKRMKSPELVEECEEKYRNAFEYHNLERCVCQSSDAFRSVSNVMIEKSFVGGVDVDRCVLQGLIPPSRDVNRTLTRDEQNKVFSIDNFNNLSLPARYLVLKECVAQIEELIEATSSEELKEMDENGRTIADICDIFRRLVRALENVINQTCESVGQAPNKTDLSERQPEDYIKYKYDDSQLQRVKEVFNNDDWIDCEESKVEEDRKTDADMDVSDDSLEMDSDRN